MSELEKFGGWPLIEGDNWKEKNFSWNMPSEFMKNGHHWGYIFALNVGTDAKNSTRRVISVGRGNLRLPDEVFLMVSVQSHLEHLQHYKNALLKIFLYVGIPWSYCPYPEVQRTNQGKGREWKILIPGGCCSSWWRPKGGTFGWNRPVSEGSGQNQNVNFDQK